jgi:hypothetical protein
MTDAAIAPRLSGGKRITVSAHRWAKPTSALHKQGSCQFVNEKFITILSNA